MGGFAAQGLKDAFASVWGGGRPVRVFRGPGRVNLIGEHTDYNLGFVLPMALDMAAFIAAAPNGTGRLRVFSENLGQSAERDTAGLAEAKPARDWSDYVFGVAQQLAAFKAMPEPQRLIEGRMHFAASAAQGVGHPTNNGPRQVVQGPLRGAAGVTDDGAPP